MKNFEAILEIYNSDKRKIEKRSINNFELMIGLVSNISASSHLMVLTIEMNIYAEERGELKFKTKL